MKPVLFLDVDDTLVLWCDGKCEHSDHPFGWDAEGWMPNQDLIELAKSWKGNIIVWSGGGKDYAEMWGRRLLKDLPFKAMAKTDLRYMAFTNDDVAFDDMQGLLDNLSSRGVKTFKPNEVGKMRKEVGS